MGESMGKLGGQVLIMCRVKRKQEDLDSMLGIPDSVLIVFMFLIPEIITI